ncbi:MAG TPA: hypothetical protein VIE67_02735 [Rudaea sp.]|uniref:hypothetical protein n=1 Tax=Rudaea sp. TaxID=2136325 RepID=UPI002F949B7E
MSVPHSTPAPHRTATIATCIASTVFGALAGGVLWCFISVSTRLETGIFILPLGIALGLFMRWQGFARPVAMSCAALSTLIAFAYAEYLFGAVRIAQMLGLPLREALFKAGFALTADIAWGNLHTRDGVLLALAILLSAGAASLRSTRRS